MENLSNAKIKKIYQIEGISTASEKIKRRLLELGLTKGQKVVVVRKSLLGKVFLIEIRGYTLSLRKSVAKVVIIK